jgi:O-antigen/teichoic acid export membrane protein
MAKSIKVNFLYNVVYQVLQIAIPLVTTPYLSRALGPVAVGTYSFTNAVVAYFVMACVLGMSTHGVRAIASSRHDSEMLAGEFWSALTSQLLVGAVVLLAYLVYAFTLGGEYLYYYLMWSPILVGTVIDVSWFLFGLEDFGYTTARSLIIRVLGVVLIFAFVKGPEDLWCYVLITAGSKLLSSLSIWPRVLSRVSFVRPERESVKRHFLASLRLFVPVIAISLYNSLDKIMLGMISGTTEVGYYEYAGRMTSITSSVMGAMGTVVLPRVSSYVGEGREEEAVDLVGVALWLMLAMAFAFSFGLASVAPTFVPVFFGEQFMACVPLMAVLAAAVPLLSISNVLGRQWLLPNHEDGLYTRSVFVGAAVDIVLNLFMIPTWGALGASLSTVVAEFSVVVAQAFFVRGKLPLRKFLLGSVPFLIMGGVMFAAIRAYAVFANGQWGVSVVSLVTQILVGAGVYATLALAYCVLTKNAQFKRLFLRGR